MISLNRFPEALAAFEHAIKLRRELADSLEVAKCYVNVGNIHYKLADYQNALLFYQRGSSIFERFGDKRIIAQSYLSLANVYHHLFKDSLVINYYNWALKVFEQVSDSRLIASTLINRGNFYLNRGFYQKALSDIEKGLSIHINNGEKSKVAYGYNHLADLFIAVGNYDLALKHAANSRKIAEEIGDKTTLANSISILAGAHHHLGNHTTAFKNYLDALKIREVIGDKNGIGAILTSIGALLSDQKKYNEAFSYYERAKKTLEEINDKSGLASVYMNIGEIKRLQEKRAEAVQYYTSALKLLKEFGLKHKMASCYSNIGIIHALNGQFELAIPNHLLAEKISEEVGNKKMVATANINLAGSYIETSRYTEAKKSLSKALPICLELGAKSILSACYGQMAVLESRRGDYQNAYEHYKKSVTYKDSVYNSDNTEQVVRLQLHYEFAKKEDSLKYLQILGEERLKQQTLLTQQQRLLAEQQLQSLLLKDKELALINSEKELQSLAYLKTQSDLEAEQIRGQQKEKQLIISEQEKSLQQSKLDLQGAELLLKSNQLQSEKTQRYILFAGAAALMAIAFFIYRNFQNQRKINRLIKAAAEKENVELQLQSLRAQLNPHFMFNSLNAIQELIVTEKNELSQSYLERFALLLRTLLENANQPFVTLQKEIDFLKLYLSLENLRLPDLKYSIHIDPQIEPEKTLTPNMMLQPYIENALWHGLQNKRGEKKLELHISRQNGSLHYDIRDNGVGRKQAAEFKSQFRKGHNSKGMELLSKRFALLSKEYGKEIKTTISDIEENGAAGGTVVSISVPAALAESKKEFAV